MMEGGGVNLLLWHKKICEKNIFHYVAVDFLIVPIGIPIGTW